MSNPTVNPDTISAVVSSAGYVEVTEGVMKKRISLKDYSSVINRLVGEEDQDIELATFRYPQSIHSVSKTNNGYIVNLYYDGGTATLTHSRHGRAQVYMPNVMIRVTLMEVHGTPGSYSFGQVHWYATDRSRESLSAEWPSGHSTQDHIWTLPLPNVFGGATMCLGGNRLPSVIYSDWTVLDMLYNDILVGSPFNDDLSINCVDDYQCPSEWFRKLRSHFEEEDTEQFPYELLENY